VMSAAMNVECSMCQCPVMIPKLISAFIPERFLGTRYIRFVVADSSGANSNKPKRLH